MCKFTAIFCGDERKEEAAVLWFPSRAISNMRPHLSASHRHSSAERRPGDVERDRVRKVSQDLQFADFVPSQDETEGRGAQARPTEDDGASVEWMFVT
jgi:hypothetical protein